MRCHVCPPCGSSVLHIYSTDIYSIYRIKKEEPLGGQKKVEQKVPATTPGHIIPRMFAGKVLGLTAISDTLDNPCETVRFCPGGSNEPAPQIPSQELSSRMRLLPVWLLGEI